MISVTILQQFPTYNIERSEKQQKEKGCQDYYRSVECKSKAEIFKQKVYVRKYRSLRLPPNRKKARQKSDDFIA